MAFCCVPILIGQSGTLQIFPGDDDLVNLFFRAERLLEEYAEAKLAMLNTLAPATTDEDDDEDCRSTAHGASNAPVSRPRDTRSSSSVAGNPAPKSRQNSGRHWQQTASFRAAVENSAPKKPPLQENRALRENRDSRPAIKQLGCSHEGRSPLGTISRQNSLAILGAKNLPPLPPQHVHQYCGHFGN